MILNTVVSSVAFPNETLDIYLNDYPNLDNARAGVRFRNYYYNNDDKLFFGIKNFALSSIANIGDTTDSYDTDDGTWAGAIYQPFSFVSVPNDFPVRWYAYQCPNHYCDLTLLGALSSIVIHPSQPYPLITKNSNRSINVSGCFLPFQYKEYGDEEDKSKVRFRKELDLSKLQSGTDLNLFVYKGDAFVSASRRNYELAVLRNNKRKLFVNLGKKIITDSFLVEVPLITAKNQEDDAWTYDLYYKSNSLLTTIETGRNELTGVVYDDFNDLNISQPYFTNTYDYVNSTKGALRLKTTDNFYFTISGDVKVTYETFDLANTQTYFQQIGSVNNYWRCGNESNTNSRVYFYNYIFLYSATGVAMRNAFTVSFTNSAGILSSIRGDYGTEFVDVSSVMIDNFLQTNFSIDVPSKSAVTRFVERTEDYSLSAYDLGTGRVYKNMEWMPASATMRFFNNGLANNYTAAIQVSTYTGAIHESYDDVNFILNGKNLIANLTITEQTDVSATVESLLFPTPDPALGVKWDASPPENIEFRSLITGEVLERNTFYPGEFDVEVHNLGVDRTQIIMYTAEYETSASTYWFPSSAIYSDLSLELHEGIRDLNQTNSGEISALVRRNGFLYRVPTDANIAWNESQNDARGSVELFDWEYNTPLSETTVYPSINNYSIINAEFTTIPVEQNPKRVPFNINCNVFSKDYTLVSNRLLSFRQFPSGNLLTIDAQKSGDSVTYNSGDYVNIIYTTGGTVSLSAIYPDLILDSANITWTVLGSDNVSVSSVGAISTFSLSTTSATVILSGVSGRPFEGNFGTYNFSDTLKFYNLPVTPLNYIGFPGSQHLPNKTVTFNTYSESNGMSSLNACHTENFYFSATPGFDTYRWQVGNIISESTGNTTIIPVQYNNVSASGFISVSAFSEIFPENNPITIYNSASSDNSSKYKQDITFYNFPAMYASIGISNDLVDVSDYRDTPILTCELTPTTLDIVRYNLDIVLSGINGTQTKNIQDSRSIFDKYVKIGTENTDFIIPENSFNSMNVFVSGNVEVTVNGYDFCSELHPVHSNIVPLTAFNGPNLELYTAKNVVSSSEIVWFENRSSDAFLDTFSRGFTAFSFDDGTGFVQSTTAVMISTQYASIGAYTPVMTGVLSSGEVLVESWPNMIYVIDQFEDYNPIITRDLSNQNESLPYNLNDILVKPNTWQYASNINASFYKLKTNLEFLSAQCYSQNINFPKAYGGFLGTKFGNFKWNQKYSATGLDDNYFKNLKSGQFVNGELLCVNDVDVSIFDISSEPSLIFSENKLGTGEILGNPIKIHYYGETDRLYILDRSKNVFLVFSFDPTNPELSELTHYWGGRGDRLGRTKLNDPTDFTVDHQGNIYVVDSGSFIVKVYNKHLNWIYNITNEDWTEFNPPLSISTTENILSVTTLDGSTFITTLDGIVLNTIYVEGATRSVLNPLHYGIIYIVSGNKIIKYMINGSYVVTYETDNSINDIIFDEFHMFCLSDRAMLKMVDFIQVDSILNDNVGLSGFPWESIYVNEHEFVTDYIYNDSFKKIFDNIQILNSRIDTSFHVELNEYGDPVTQNVSAFGTSALTIPKMFVGTNEPVLYDTINRGLTLLYGSMVELKGNTDIVFTFPNNTGDLQWIWKYHYIDSIQYPTIFKNPVSWIELSGTKITTNTTLSAASSWCAIRDGNIGGNHSEICWNFEQTQCNSYFPLSWEDMECGNACGHIFTWEDMEKNCCEYPEHIFADCVSGC